MYVCEHYCIEQNIRGTKTFADFSFTLNRECFVHEFSNAMTRIRKFFIKPRKFFREYSQGDLTAKVLSLECFVLYGNDRFLN